ncbi:MAG: endonuclease III [Gemmatimonadota bacterium]
MIKRRAAPKKRAAKKRPAKQRAAPRRGRQLAPASTRAPEIFGRLAAEYPDAHCALDHRSPFELLAATILSAQCTDKRVNLVTPALFAKYPNARALAVANPAELQAMIRSTGFFNNKTRSLLGMAAAVVEQHAGEVPATMEDLHALPGVGRKTANVVLGNAFGRDEGVVVDTHVTRLSQRLGLTKEKDAVKIEQDLMTMFPRRQWTLLAHLLISHGRSVCDARRPQCDRCVVQAMCPSSTLKS